MRQGVVSHRRDVYWEGSGFLSYWTFDDLAGKVSQMRMCFESGGKVFVNWHHFALHGRVG